jgi:hypothetical protein
MTAEAFPALADLIGACFHQDYDIEGETIPEIVGAFRAVTTPAERANVCTDIARFIAEHPDDLEEALEITFQPGVVPSAFSRVLPVRFLTISTKCSRRHESTIP